MNDLIATAGRGQLPELCQALHNQWSSYQNACAQQGLRPPEDPEFLNLLFRVWAASPWVSDYCTRHPQWLLQAQANGHLQQALSPEYYHQQLAARLQILTPGDEATLGRHIRQFRHAEMARIAWRDLAGWAPLEETLHELSWLAEACLQQAYQVLYPWHCATWGTPQNADGVTQPLIVLGMGKLGAHELNFSSDIDLIFVYPEAGQTVGVRSRSHEEFFRSLCQRLIQALDAVTADGFAYRVDTRLRPYGESGPLAMNFSAMETYYQVSGREWERYALIKARPVAGDIAQGEELLRQLRPFIYRRYPDFSAFESLRAMKALIMQEVKRKDKQQNIKLGAGGIREIEFIGQVFQLVQGGRIPALQQRPILKILAVLGELGRLPAQTVADLTAAYIFLRRLENRLQAYADQQTHDLPQNPLRQLGIALSLDFSDWNALLHQVNHYRALVEQQFSQVFSPIDHTTASPAENILSISVANLAEWAHLTSAEASPALDYLARYGFQTPQTIWLILANFLKGSLYRHLSNHGRQRLDSLLPKLLQSVATLPDPAPSLTRLLELITVIAKRSTYLALLSENPASLARLVKLSAASPWMIKQLQRVPLLLDQLLDQRLLYPTTAPSALEADLAQRIATVPPADTEQILETLRHFKQSHVLNIAAVDILDQMPLMIVSDHLTLLAEVILNQVLKLAQQDLKPRYGQPGCTMDGIWRPVQFIIVGYGKFGGWELGYSSDLDLVFIQDGEGELCVTQGPQVVENEWYFARLVQRILHYLNTNTHSGLLYEVDTRLRPNGQSGLLVSRFHAFIDYQQHRAWTWEHQALVRARPVAGDAALSQAFITARQKLLANAVRRETLAQEISTMRQKIRQQHPETNGLFHLKHSMGGLIDIEFIVQYCILKYGAEYCDLLTYSDNIRQLDAIQHAGLLSITDTECLQTAYRDLRRRLHHLTLQEQPPLVPPAEVSTQIQPIIALWQRLLYT